MIKHLKEQKVGYWKHWWRAIRISGALIIHAFLPDVLSDYASKEICDDDDLNISNSVGILYVRYTQFVHTVRMLKLNSYSSR